MGCNGFPSKLVDSTHFIWCCLSHIGLKGGIVVVMIVILMGVSGSGKTTIGKGLAERLGWRFFEGDEFHPQANITKMGKGIPLSDEDRQPWLNALKKLIDQLILKQESAVIACSALKEAYRETLKHKNNEVCFVYLKGEYELIEKRLEERSNHYMKGGLLSTQRACESNNGRHWQGSRGYREDTTRRTTQLAGTRAQV
jgi:gluconokinase